MVESLTYCSVCFEEYDQEERVPLMLSCGHTFCKNCLILLPEPLRCPHCRTLESRTLKELPKNITIFQIQAQLNPSEVEMCTHEELLFYCKVCKYPLCLQCVVKHSNHGLLNLNDPELENLINSHLDQIESAYKFRIKECTQRKEKAESLLANWKENSIKNKEAVRGKFQGMRKIVENQEQYYLEHIAQLFQSMCSKNEREDNPQNGYRVDVSIDEEWLTSNLKKIGNIGVFNPARQECSIRRSRNVKALNWKYSGRIDALSFKSNKQVYLSGIGVCTPYKLEKTTVINEMKLLKGQSSRSEVVYLHSFPVTLVADFMSGVTKVPFETIVKIEPGIFYTIYLKLSGAKTFKCVDSLVQANGRDETVFSFANTIFVQGDESNRTDILCGPIVDFYYLP